MWFPCHADSHEESGSFDMHDGNDISDRLDGNVLLLLTP